MTNRLKNIIYGSIIFFLIITITGCTLKSGDGIRTTIKGSFPAFKGKSVSLSEFDINAAIPLDTASIAEDGSFKFKFYRNSPGFYLIKVDNKNYLTLVLDEENKVEISSSESSLRKNYNVEGSPDSQLFHDFEMFIEISRKKLDSLGRSNNDYQRSSHFRSEKLESDINYKEIFNRQQQYTIQFLQDNCSSLASLLVINRRFGDRKILTESEDFKYYTLIDSCLSQKYEGNKHLVEFKDKIGAYLEKQKMDELTARRLAIGNKAPDISLQDPAGKEVKLYSFQGKPVILYFWASWDKESRKSNIVIKEIVEKAVKEKPVVYAIGLESYKELWEDAIRADGLQNWIHVTDYLNVYSSAKSLFNIPDKLPYFILLDKELRIRYKGFSFEDLSNELSLQMQ